MRLHGVKLQGFRRFEVEQNLEVSSKLTAVVGPNEAGKTSLLRAISYCADNRKIAPYDRTTLSDVDVAISLRFFLDQDDLNAADLDRPSWFHVVKREDGELRYDLLPRPKRDINRRKSAWRAINKISSTKALRLAVEALAGDTDLQPLMSALHEISENEDVLTEDAKAALSAFARVLSGDASEPLKERASALRSQIIELLAFEDNHDPFQNALNVLAKRTPAILDFTPDYRDINIPFNLSFYNHPEKAARKQPTRALAEIIRLSGLDLDTLKSAIEAGNDAAKAGLLADANKTLAELSKAAWRQSDASLIFQIDGWELTILVRNEHDFHVRDQFATFESRSDGFKQFIALMVFTFLKKRRSAILLIDEIENHLHYDAQADLVQLLQNEETVGSVIYTTHSAGALPEDLGVGVRMIIWDSVHKKQSNIVNRFWHKEIDSGFRPLLFGMGATTFAFFPTRRALIAEGPTEMLLMPRLMREAMSAENLNFQIVHGLSNIRPTGLPMLDNAPSRVCYITDSDKAGLGLRADLLKAGVSMDSIFSVGDVGDGLVTIEDLIDESAWLHAVNAYIGMYGESRGLSHKILTAPLTGRIASLPKAIRKEKVFFAYEILTLVQDDPSRQILSPPCRRQLRTIGSRIQARLEAN